MKAQAPPSHPRVLRIPDFLISGVQLRERVDLLILLTSMEDSKVERVQVSFEFTLPNFATETVIMGEVNTFLLAGKPLIDIRLPRKNSDKLLLSYHHGQEHLQQEPPRRQFDKFLAS